MPSWFGTVKVALYNPALTEVMGRDSVVPLGRVAVR